MLRSAYSMFLTTFYLLHLNFEALVYQNFGIIQPLTIVQKLRGCREHHYGIRREFYNKQVAISMFSFLLCATSNVPLPNQVIVILLYYYKFFLNDVIILQVRPPVKVTYKKWVQCERVPEKLETMAAVWQGITHLKSTRAFCEYLYNEHPEIKPPRYLIDSGMMDPDKLKEESICSIKSTDSFGNVSRLSFSLLK